ncbi:Hypothetical predicted protein [Mytilus galloprovincialis]|uniref:Helitron helicase-like domain-containing protein n=1 Tax=Mytilus galloprovincialis TaxID=29158 RepID=A0A8B6HMU7_MYTGA|nr:Hypothetical predicted protein [Mytilus galloprovincialis]
MQKITSSSDHLYARVNDGHSLDKKQKITRSSDHSYAKMNDALPIVRHFNRMHPDHQYCKKDEVSYLVPHLSFADIVKSVPKKPTDKNEIISVKTPTSTQVYDPWSPQNSKQTYADIVTPKNTNTEDISFKSEPEECKETMTEFHNKKDKHTVQLQPLQKQAFLNVPHNGLIIPEKKQKVDFLPNICLENSLFEQFDEVPITNLNYNESLNKNNQDQQLQDKCIKLGINIYEPSIKNETAKEYNKRCKKIQNRIGYTLNKIQKPDTPQKDTDLHTKCRKLGLTYDAPVENETPNEYKKRCVKNYNKIKYKLNKLNINFETIPDPPPFADDEHFNKAVNCIRSFELQEMSYTIDVCSVCFERKINLKKKNSVCERCFKDKVVIKMFSTENNMNPGEVPLELANLSVVEEQLISRISPCINIHMLKHGGIAANGHCVAFPQEAAKSTNSPYMVKKNNPANSDIEISEERLNLLPEDGQIQNIHTLEYNSNVGHLNDQGPAPKQIDPGNVEGETISSVLLPEPCFDIKQKIQDAVDEIATEENTNISINKKGQVSIPWPTRGKIPLSEFTTRHFFTLAFPCLFPHACADFHMNRPLTCSSMSDWANHLIWYKDGRFAKHKFFKFIVHNIINRKRVLDNSTFIVQQKLGENMLTLSDLKAKLQTGDKSVAEKILYFSANLRGTSQYWNQRSKELRALIQYKINEGQGLPSFFTTGSCAEFYFKPLKRILSLYIKETTGNEIDLNDHNKMFKAVQDNTHIVGDYFDKRTQSYFKEIMGPVFGVNSYWYRQEFSKSRGMIHWHGLCWRFDKEPHNLMHQAYVDGKTDEECAKLLSDWAKLEYKMTANHPAGLDENNKPKKNLWPPPEGTAPAPPDEKNPLNKLLMDVSESQESILEDHLLLCNRINLHRCSDYCLRAPRNNPSNPVKQCRMEFGTSLNPGKNR